MGRRAETEAGLEAESGILPATESVPRPLKVFITVDVELWPTNWENHRKEFPDSFRRYILGDTGRGVFGLPFQLRMARDHGLRIVFFVESLFACEMGPGPLREIVDMVTEAGQEVQLHAHPEWVRHASAPILDIGDRYLLAQLSEAEQLRLISVALANLEQAGARQVIAFRAGSFSANEHTLKAVSRAGLAIDSSLKIGSPVGEHESLNLCPAVIDGIREYPLATYQDWPGHLRPVQLAACSTGELTHVLRAAKAQGWSSIVLLSHSAELMNAERSKPEPILMKRFERLCAFLAEHHHEFATAWLRDEDARESAPCLATPIRSSNWLTLSRVGQQVLGRLRR